MHGPPWLENPTLSIALICVGFVLLLLSIRMKRRQSGSEQGYNFEWKVFGHKILDTSNRWMAFSAFLGLVAVGSHYLVEYTFHIYDVTPVDRFTHGLSGMAVTAIVLNVNLTRGRKVSIIPLLLERRGSHLFSGR